MLPEVESPLSLPTEVNLLTQQTLNAHVAKKKKKKVSYYPCHRARVLEGIKENTNISVKEISGEGSGSHCQSGSAHFIQSTLSLAIGKVEHEALKFPAPLKWLNSTVSANEMWAEMLRKRPFLGLPW